MSRRKSLLMMCAVMTLPMLGRTGSAAMIEFADPEPIDVNHPAPFTYVSGIHAFNLVVTGGEQIAGADVGIIRGDGGAVVGGSDTSPPYPPIIDVVVVAPDYVFHAPDAFSELFQFDLIVLRVVSAVAGLRTATGILASVLIDATATPPGAYPFRLQLPSDPLQRTTLYDEQLNEIPADLGEATITVVPEPATLTLLALGAAGLRRRPRPA